MVFAGLVFLASAFLLTFYQNQILLSYVGLILGFLTFNGGMQQVARWSRKPRTDEVLDHMLSKLNDRFAIVHYPAIGGRRPDHVVVTPGGVLTLTPREVGGVVTLDGRRWKRSALKQIFNLGGPQLGNPSLENESQVATLEALFSEQGIDVDVRGVVVFVHPDVEIEMRNPETEVIHVHELYDYVRGLTSEGTTLTSDERNRIVSVLSTGERIEEVGSPSRRPRKKVKAA
jgi:hypothetical protein